MQYKNRIDDVFEQKYQIIRAIPSPDAILQIHYEDQRVITLLIGQGCVQGPC